jgi:predicted O-methyltransferase YrrM
MTQQLWTSVDDYITELFVPFDPVMQETLATSEAAGLPSISVAPNEGKLLMLLAQRCGARNILEVGTLGGYSTIWLARGMTPGGSLITLEASAKHAEIARINIARAGLTGLVEVRVGPAGDTLPQLATERRDPFDLIFIDADKEGYPRVFRMGPPTRPTWQPDYCRQCHTRWRDFGSGKQRSTRPGHPPLQSASRKRTPGQSYRNSNCRQKRT